MPCTLSNFYTDTRGEEMQDSSDKEETKGETYSMLLTSWKHKNKHDPVLPVAWQDSRYCNTSENNVLYNKHKHKNQYFSNLGQSVQLLVTNI